MSHELNKSVEARITHLERSTGRWRIATLSLLSALGAVALLGAAPTPRDVVTAKQFDVVDEAGRIRASLGFDDGNSFLVFKDASGAVRTHLVLQSDGTTGLNLRDRKSVDRVSLSLLADENNSLVFRKSDKSASQSIGGRPDGDLIGNRVSACETKLGQPAGMQSPPVMTARPGVGGGATGQAAPGAQRMPSDSGGGKTQRDLDDAQARQKSWDVANLKSAKQKEIASKLDELKRAQSTVDSDRTFGSRFKDQHQAQVDKLRLELDQLRNELDAIH